MGVYIGGSVNSRVSQKNDKMSSVPMCPLLASLFLMEGVS